ncbi:hypothetical protein [Vulgatibacter sp.]|uniref:hypothetical protein n=1 Tax=Vulgatibacter sp. TaxID=1971226 RepID=UPI003568DBA7
MVFQVGEGGSTDFSKTLEGALFEGGNFSFHYFIDADTNGVCAGTDHTGIREITGVTGDVTITLSAGDPSDARGCQAFAGLPLNLRLTGSAPESWVGADLAWVLEDAEGVAIAGNVEPVEAVTLDLLLAGILELDANYGFSYFVDVNANGICDDGDHAASFVIPGVTGHVTVDRANETADLAACGDFWWMPGGLTITGAGFESYEGEIVLLSVVETFREETRVLGITEATVTGGAFEVPLADAIIAGASYQVAWLIDGDVDGACATAPTDVGGIADVVDYVGADASVFLSPAAEPTDPICAWFPGMGFDVTANATGLSAFAGMYFEAFLYDVASATLTDVEYGSIAGDGFSVTFASAGSLGSSVQVAWFIDADDSLWCDNGDPSGFSEAVEVAGATTVDLGLHQGHDAAACSEMNAYWGM